MPSKPVQISLDADLLRRIDAHPRAKKLGRSAFLREAAELYLRAQARRAVDDRIRAAYGDHEGELVADVEALMGAQIWPDE